MINIGCYRIRHIRILAEQFGTGGFWGQWKSRLDPYRCSPASGEQADLRLNNRFDWEPSGEWRLVKTVKAGICAMDVQMNDAGDTLWEYYREKNREMYVRYWMSRAYDEIRLLYDDSRTAGHLPFDLLEQLMPPVFLRHDAITFHGVLMEHEGRGIILSAPPNIGKTTHARLWRDHKRALIINGDRAACCIEDGRWIAFGIPWCGSSGESVNRDVPVTAFVALEQARVNRAERLYGLDAFEAVMPGLLYPAWDRELAGKALDFVDDFLEKVPVFRLSCRPDAESVEVLDRALREL